MAQKNKFKTYKDKESNLEWSIATTQGFNWDYAINYPENDLEDTSFHLPTLQEFQTLLNYSKKDTAFKDGVSYPIGIYWTSTQYASDTSAAWCVDTRTGQITLSSKNNVRIIVAVRKIK